MSTSVNDNNNNNNKRSHELFTDYRARGSPGVAGGDYVSYDIMNTWDVARDDSLTTTTSTTTSTTTTTIILLSAQTGDIAQVASSSEANSNSDNNNNNNNCRDQDSIDDDDGSCVEEREEIEEDMSVGNNVDYDDAMMQQQVDGAGSQLLFGYGALTAFDAAFNGTFSDGAIVDVAGSNLSDWNSSLYNDSYIIEGTYPSGYGLPHIIFASIVVTLLMIVIVIGNMLVIIAIATEKALKNIQNWFIASLAVADFFLGLVIMPFSLANEIMGYWIFGYWWCDIHSAMDVLLCTASIMNLCLISLDRFWSITKAVDYLKKRTPTRAALMIAMVWVLSAVICIPPLLGWKRSPPEEEYPKCKVTVFILCSTFLIEKSRAAWRELISKRSTPFA
ncbi:hypothetical protein TKK_0010778 [Trichogramma kaykai]|uniref:G-protein coupled receptors family 1 profile domain-containing protein n=1 Tax=Trichogramma kaykai TaxID=54128 RepID=A0ABD2WVY2_9HYME